MAVPKTLRDARGLWKGTSQLHLSYLPVDQQVSTSASELRIDGDDYAAISYSWEHEGAPKIGTMLVAMDDESKAVEIGWTDSFHMASAVMHLVGIETETGAVETQGSFSAGEENWGWTIAFDLTDDTLMLTMDVVPPGEAPDWAVKAVYRRS